MKKLIGRAPRKRSRFEAFAAGAVIVLGVALTAPAPALAKAQVEGSPDAVRVEAENTSIEEILAALGNTFALRYRSSINLGKQLSGTYRGPLERVVRRILEGYDFVLKLDNGRLEVTVLAPRNAAATVAAAPPALTKPAANSTPASASAPASASGSPAPPVPQAEPGAAMKVAEGGAALSADARAELNTMPGVSPAAPMALSKIPGMRPVLESAPGGQPRP